MVIEYFSIMESKQASPAIDNKSHIFIGEIVELKIKVDKLNFQLKKLERTVDWIGNYVEEQTSLEPGKELTDSSDSSESDYDYVIHNPEEKVHKVKCVKKRYSNKKVKHKRYPSRSVNIKSTNY